MKLTLTIVNKDSLPGGAPLSYEAGNWDIEIGRAQGVEWTLPDLQDDPEISRTHCRIRAEAGGYMLYDPSANGTFVNDDEQRVIEPYRLRDGDRIRIADYEISVRVEDSRRAPSEPPEMEAAPLHPKFVEPRRRRDEPPPLLQEHLPEYPPVFDDRKKWYADASDPLDEPPVPPPFGPVFTNPKTEANPASIATSAAHRADDWIERFAAGVGLDKQALQHLNDGQMADMLSALVRMTVENLIALLKSRAEMKDSMRQTRRTEIHAAGNNPLKYAPNAEHALALMFSHGNSRAYLDVKTAVAQGFEDLKAHQFATTKAMRDAVDRLLKELDPRSLAEGAKEAGKLGALFPGSRARLWEQACEKWSLLEERHEGIENLFWRYFGDSYVSR